MRIANGIYLEKVSSSKRAELNGRLRAKAAEMAEASAKAKIKAMKAIYDHRS